jgi:lipoate-protein ligase B
VETWRRVGKSGAWTKAGKIAAIGFRIRRWITSHGMSFNVEGDLAGFSAIVPCGLTGEPVGTLETCLGGRSPGMPLVGEALLEAFESFPQREDAQRLMSQLR